VSNVIEEFFVALGFRVDPAGLKGVRSQVEQAKESIFSMGNAIKAFATGFVAKSIIGISDTFEQNTIAISGFLEALELSKPNEGMADAAATIQQITRDAAKLPGEASEYIEVFRAGLPVLKAALPGGSIEDMTAFTNRFAAIGKTLQVDAGQIGRDLSLMLGVTGRAGGNVLTFARMLPFMRQLKGQAALTAESFNVMTQPARLKLLQDALANPALTAMLERAAGSFDAMLGAAKSMVSTLVRLGTAGVFEALKRGLDRLRAVFIDDRGELTAFGNDVVAVSKTVVQFVGQIIESIGALVMWIAKVPGVATTAKVALGALLALKLGPFGVFASMLALVIEDIYTFINGGQSLIGHLIKRWPKALAIAATALLASAAATIALKIEQIKLALVAVATAARMAAAWLLAMAPLALAVLAIAAVGVAIYALWQNWDEIVGYMEKRWKDFIEGIKRAPKDFANALGFGSDEDVARMKAQQGAPSSNPAAHGQRLAPGAEVYWRNPEAGKEEIHSAGWTPPASATAAPATNTTTQTNTFNITSTDPKEAGREVERRLTRNAQSKVGL